MDEEVNPIAEKTEILELEVIVAVWGGGGAGLAEDKEGNWKNRSGVCF